MPPLRFIPLPPGAPVLAAAVPGPDLAAAGYGEQELRVAGTAHRFLPGDGPGGVEPADEAPFVTRAVLRAPAEDDRASGVLVVEWLNVSSGSDTAPEWTYLAEEIVRRGHAWLGVSAQQVGVTGGTPSVGGPPSPGLRGTDPERYGDLAHPGDAYSYDLFTQVAAAVDRPGGPLAGRRVGRRIAVGESQSAFALTTYVNHVAPSAEVFDGYLVHSRGRGRLGLGAPGRPHDVADVRSGAPVAFRGDLAAPVIAVQTETDVLSPRFRSVEARQPDGPLLRLWEVAGSAHADHWHIGEFESLLGCPEPVNRGQQAYVLRAALRALETWTPGAAGPPYAERLAVVDGAGDRFELDTAGNVRGGVRTPCVDVPTQQLSGLGSPESSVLCSLFGATRELPSDLLRARYPSVAGYLAAYAASVDATIEAGFALEEDRAALLAEARPDLVASALA
ncbi:MAG TPA: alpha/beta hydrolase domain-containing protein [Nocardioides sp.]|nr:alpha/beta hydrolase domain-containing protein [Nocardioides sp.]